MRKSFADSSRIKKNILRLDALDHLGHFQIDDLNEIRLGQRVEDDGVIEPV